MLSEKGEFMSLRRTSRWRWLRLCRRIQKRICPSRNYLNSFIIIEYFTCQEVIVVYEYGFNVNLMNNISDLLHKLVKHNGHSNAHGSSQSWF